MHIFHPVKIEIGDEHTEKDQQVDRGKVPAHPSALFGIRWLTDTNMA